MDISISGTNQILDSSFNPVQYRGLNYSTNYIKNNYLGCDKAKRMYHDSDGDGDLDTTRNLSCINSQGQDMSKQSDYTHAFKITYYFR